MPGWPFSLKVTAGLAGAALVTLQLAGVIQWPWLWILSPIWIGIGVWLGRKGLLAVLRPFHKRDDPNLRDEFLQAHVDGLGPPLLLVMVFVVLTLSGEIARSEWWVLTPIWLCLVTWIAATVFLVVVKPAPGADVLRNVAGTSRAMLFVMGSAVSLTMVFIVLRMLGQTSWEWFWVVSPIWAVAGLMLVWLVFLSLTWKIGREWIVRITDQLVTWGWFAGPGGFLTLVFAAMKLAGTIQWSWWWVLVPLGVNIATWTIIYIATVLFSHFVLRKMH